MLGLWRPRIIPYKQKEEKVLDKCSRMRLCQGSCKCNEIYLLAVEGISRRPTLRRPRPRSLTWPEGRLRSTRFADLGIAETR